MEWTRTEEIKTVENVRPHFVLVGAGASCAAFPNGDGKGRRLPLMNDLVSVVGLDKYFEDFGIQWKGQNFEDLYVKVATDNNYLKLKEKIEYEVDLYFSQLTLPEEPTIYDFLILSLRSQDVIATFNWDPFLIRAYRRNKRNVQSLPYLLFLHGNVLSGFCDRDNTFGLRDARCSKCGSLFTPTKLLYPIDNKDYISDKGIATAWQEVERKMGDALFLTIYGYGAPKSDRAAMDLLSSAWGTPEQRNFEQIEIIDIRTEEELLSQWDRFIHTHHYHVVNNFYDSWLANHPRRSIEAFISQYHDANFVEGNPLPSSASSLQEVWSWYDGLIHYEK